MLRRKPSGPLLKGSYAIERESKVQQAFGSIGFPVARVHGLCENESVIGARFYIMDCVDGQVFWNATFPTVSHAERPAYFDAMNEILARLHSIDYAAIGLADYGRSANYFDRQITRWSKQYLEDVDGGRDPRMEELIEWLPRIF